MELFSLNTGSILVDPAEMFVGVSKAVLEKQYGLQENGLCKLTLRSILLISEDRTILFDCGVGSLVASLNPDYICLDVNAIDSSLDKLSLVKDDVTDIVLTHLHFDHCGGLISMNNKGAVVESFPNATYWMSKEQLDTSLNPSSFEKDSFSVECLKHIQSRKKLVLCKDSDHIVQDVSVRLFNGHTKGLLLPIIIYKGLSIVFVGDLIPTSMHLSQDVTCGFDVDQELTKYEKLLLHNKSLNDCVYFFQHDKNVECCNLMRKGEDYCVNQIFLLSDII